MAGFHAMPSISKGYALRKAGAKRAIKIGLSRVEAWKEARRRARAAGSVAYLHGTDGRVVTRNSYDEV